jgi:hypothetical protein
MTDRQCIYHPKDVSRKRQSRRINRSGDGQNMVEDCMVRSTTNRCVLTDKRRVSRAAKKTEKHAAKKSAKREQAQSKRDAVKLREQEIKLSYDKAVEEAHVKVEQVRLRLRKAFGVRKNEPDTPEIIRQLNDMRDVERVAIYKQFKDDVKYFTDIYTI